MRIAAIGGNGAPPPEIQAIVSTGFECTMVPGGFSTFTINQAHQKMSELSTMQAGLKAAADGYDAVFIGTVGDYALHAMRSALRIPVVGAGEAAMHAALTLGRKFSIVTIWPPTMLFLYRDLLRLYAMEPHCTSIRCVTDDEEIPDLKNDTNFYTEMRRGEPTQEDRIVRACERAMNEDSADVIVLGCTCMSPIAAKIATRVEIPVLNPMTVGYKYTEMLLALRQCHSVRAYPTVPVSIADRVDAAAAAINGLDQNEMRKRVAARIAAE